MQERLPAGHPRSGIPLVPSHAAFCLSRSSAPPLWSGGRALAGRPLTSSNNRGGLPSDSEHCFRSLLSLSRSCAAPMRVRERSPSEQSSESLCWHRLVQLRSDGRGLPWPAKTMVPSDAPLAEGPALEKSLHPFRLNLTQKLIANLENWTRSNVGFDLKLWRLRKIERKTVHRLPRCLKSITKEHNFIPIFRPKNIKIMFCPIISTA